MASPVIFPDWQSDYQTALREYGFELFDSALQRALANCMSCLADLPRDIESCTRRQSCLVALSDLLLLRRLHYKYELLRIANDDRESRESMNKSMNESMWEAVNDSYWRED
jgi:hypothetical protein